MKTILIYGDSNTWGDNMLTNKRIPREKRWPTILEKKNKNTMYNIARRVARTTSRKRKEN